MNQAHVEELKKRLGWLTSQGGIDYSLTNKSPNGMLRETIDLCLALIQERNQAHDKAIEEAVETVRRNHKYICHCTLEGCPRVMKIVDELQSLRKEPQ